MQKRKNAIRKLMQQCFETHHREADIQGDQIERFYANWATFGGSL